MEENRSNIEQKWSKIVETKWRKKWSKIEKQVEYMQRTTGYKQRTSGVQMEDNRSPCSNGSTATASDVGDSGLGSAVK